mgnify:FL=1
MLTNLGGYFKYLYNQRPILKKNHAIRDNVE